MESITVRELVQRTATFFNDRGLPSPRLDADLLVAHVLGTTRTGLYGCFDRPVTDEERDALRELVRRRAAHEPIAYLLGERGFWTLDLRVDPRVLVPRPETERIVELTLEAVGVHREHPWRVVDVGTGSGAIALAIASELPAATVLGSDTSAGALEVAADNAERCGLRDRVRLVRDDLLGALVRKRAQVDIVVSNPPYIATTEHGIMDRDVLEHEPHEALFAGHDGLDVIRRLLPQAQKVLVPGGLLLVEFGAAQGEAVRALAAQHFERVRIAKDLAGHDRVLVARAAGRHDVLDAQPPVPEPTPESAPAVASQSEEEPLSAAQWRLREAEDAGLPIIDMDAE